VAATVCAGALLAAAPRLAPAAYVWSLPPVALWLLYSFTRNGWGFFLLDFCYFANAAAWLFFLFAPAAPAAAAAAAFAPLFALATGPLLLAHLFWRVSLVLHSADKMASVFIHTAAPLADKHLDYEALLAPESAAYAWPALDENDAAMICYTSGTTGNPKGVVYSHRSCVLHTLVACMTDTLGVSEGDTVLPVVPMFHANAWGLPFCAAATGAKLVVPGPHLDAASIVDLMASEKVTLAAGVPTIWLGILALLDQDPARFDLSSVRSMVIGGAAAPPTTSTRLRAPDGLRIARKASDPPRPPSETRPSKLLQSPEPGCASNRYCG
jgi:acyl-CoA synthetase (AMP-forming)/AMP-acid ligase II